MSVKIDELLNADDVDLQSLVPFRKRLTINGRRLILCEADGEAARQHKNLSMRAAKFGPDGKLSSLEGIADVETQLVADCLFFANDNNEPGQKVGLPFAKSLPYRLVKPMYELIKKVSDLSEEEENEEFLEKRIKADTDKLAKLREDNHKSLVGNGQTSTTNTSQSVEN